MKWNGSIYYNVISQDNVGVDRVVLELPPCPVLPSHYWQQPRKRWAERTRAQGEHIGEEPSHLLPSSQQIEVEEVSRTQLLLLGSPPSSWALEWSCPIKYILGSLRREKSENEPWPFLNAWRMLSQTRISLSVEIRDSRRQGKKQNLQLFEENSHIFQRKHETKTAHVEVNKS